MKQRELKYCVWFLLLLGYSSILSAQNVIAENTAPGSSLQESITAPAANSSLFIVRNIFISGNRKTRPDIILRELPFKTGDQFLLQDIVKKFEEARQQLMNTTLFHEVIVSLKSFEGYNVDILIQVKERWYIFPIPYFRPVDRNFNQWLVEQKGSLERVDYGLKMFYNNITGRNDKLKAWLIGGYNHQI
ncbi:MAG TPA: POTRA domain-containing protein, partial [Chitinophagaceae bacterium]|nr:POTRA domain-containing protein [Chitinophagaceae bacterium]